MRWVTPIVVGLALVVAAVALVLSLTRTSDTASEADIDAVRSEVAALQDAGEAVDAEEVTTNLRQNTRRLRKVEDCLPELQAQLNNMEVTGGYAYPNQQVSTYCRDLMYGPMPGGE